MKVLRKFFGISQELFTKSLKSFQEVVKILNELLKDVKKTINIVKDIIQRQYSCHFRFVTCCL